MSAREAYRRGAAAVAAAVSLVACDPDPTGPTTPGAPGAGPSSLTVCAAASLADAVEEIGAHFRGTTGADVTYNFAASGALAQQLIAAPRGDVFLSASGPWMDAVEEAGRLIDGTRRQFLGNSLAVIAHPDSGWEIGSPAEIAALPVSLLAIGDPGSVPAGEYAATWLRSVGTVDGSSLWDSFRGRLSPCPDVRAVLAQVAARRDLLGIVYASDYTAASHPPMLLYPIPPAQTPGIAYHAGVVRTATEPDLARQFVEALGSEQARTIFHRHGFAPPATTDAGTHPAAR